MQKAHEDGKESTMEAMDRAKVTAAVHTTQEVSVPEISWADRLAKIGTEVLRYGLVFLLVAVGSTKFFDFEAKAIQPLVGQSVFLSWMYRVLTVQEVSNVFGLIEITTGILIALRRIAPKASAVGSLAAIVIFVTTLSFLFTTPGALAPGSGVGGFLMKDIILLGAAIYTAGEGLRASPPR
jgi:reactive chlorine resistance protein C